MILETVRSIALAVRINKPLFRFLLFWRVDRDEFGSTILVRDGPPAPARNALSEHGSAYLKRALEIEDIRYHGSWHARLACGARRKYRFASDAANLANRIVTRTTWSCRAAFV